MHCIQPSGNGECFIEEPCAGAPRKVRKIQSVRIRSMKRLTISIESTIAWQAVTNVVKPMEETYQAATQVKGLSPEIGNIVEADALCTAEGSMKSDAMVSYSSLYRGPRPWHGMRWRLRELGRSLVFLVKRYARTSQQRRERANEVGEVRLTDSTLNLGKPSTWGSGQRWRGWLRTIQTNTQRLG